LENEDVEEAVKALSTGAKKEGEGAKAGAEKDTPAKDTPDPKKEQDAGANAGAEKDTPAKDTPAPGSEKGDDKDKLFAGKYKTVDELKAAVLNAGKVLKYNEKLLQKSIAAITDPKELEELYKELDVAVSANNKAAAPAKDEQRQTQPDGEAAVKEQREIARQIVTTTVQTIRKSDVAEDLRELGLPLPEKYLTDAKVTEEYMADLKERSYGVYNALKSLTEQVFGRTKGSVLEYVGAMKESEKANVATIDGEKASIKAYAAEIALPLTDEELNAFVDGALNMPMVYEEKNGVPYVAKNGLFNAFYLKNRETIEKALQAKASIKAVEDYNKAHANMEKETAGAGVSGSRAAAPAKKNAAGNAAVTADEFKKLTEAEQDAIIEKTE